MDIHGGSGGFEGDGGGRYEAVGSLLLLIVHCFNAGMRKEILAGFVLVELVNLWG